MKESLIEKKADETPATSSRSLAHKENREFIGYALSALALAVIIRLFIASPWLVSGPSMMPNFQDMNYLIVDRLSYRLGTPQRGDVIVFSLPQMPSRDLIKRVIGLPGETVEIKGNAVTIKNAAHPQGFTLSEPYIAAEDVGGPDGITVTLNAHEYYVLGDNRHVSADSRTWGVLPDKDIIGKVFVRLYPFNEISMLPAQSRYTQDVVIGN